MSTAALSLDTLDERRLPGPAAALPRRRSALADFAAAGWPTTRRENWRYTDLKPLAARSFDFTPPAPTTETVSAARHLLAEFGLPADAPRLVLVDGHRVPALETPLPNGITIRDLDARDDTAAPLHNDRHPLASLNMALTQGGLWLQVAAGQRVAATVHLIFIASNRASLAPQPRVRLDASEGCEAAFAQHFIDVAGAEGWINSVTEIAQAPDSRLALYRLQEHGEPQSHTGLVTASLAARAHLSVGFVDLGGRLVRNDIDVELTEPGANVELFGVFTAGEAQHVDDHTRIDHLARETTSDEVFRGIIGHRGRGVFNGKVVVHRNAQRIDARQSNDNLLLSDHAEIDTKPELEIYADDVKCSHGSTVGELDPEQLFYLRSRGMDELAAREVLTSAFAAAVLERITDTQLRTYIASRVAARLRTLTEHRS